MGVPMWIEAGDALLRTDAERIEHAPVIGVPFGDPVRAVAERVGGEHQVHGGGAGGEGPAPRPGL